MSDLYDYIIVGGGLSGLYFAYKLLLFNSQLKVLILEASSKLGGKTKPLQFPIYQRNNQNKYQKQNILELDSEHFSPEYHPLLIDLIKEAGLLDKLSRRNSDLSYILANKYYKTTDQEGFPFNTDGFNNVNELIAEAYHIFKNTGGDESQLYKMSAANLLEKMTTYDQLKFIKTTYPYWSLLNLTNAEEGKSHLLQSALQGDYYSLKDGLSQIIDFLSEKIRKLGGHIYLSQQVTLLNESPKLSQVVAINTKISSRIIEPINPDQRYKIKTNTKINKKTNKKTNKKKEDNWNDIAGGKNKNKQGGVNFYGKKIIFAVAPASLKKISSLGFIDSISSLLNSIITVPTCKIYMVFPKIKGNVWFSGLGRVVTSNTLNYIIPISEKYGIIMVSYTDGQLTIPLFEANLEGRLLKYLLRQLERLFPNRHITKPLYHKVIYDKNGSYLIPPGIDGHHLRDSILKATELPIYLIGDSYSYHQGWIEGSLETALKCFLLANQDNQDNLDNLDNQDNSEILDKAHDDIEMVIVDNEVNKEDRDNKEHKISDNNDSVIMEISK